MGGKWQRWSRVRIRVQHVGKSTTFLYGVPQPSLSDVFLQLASGIWIRRVASLSVPLLRFQPKFRFVQTTAVCRVACQVLENSRRKALDVCSMTSSGEFTYEARSCFPHNFLVSTVGRHVQDGIQ